MKIHRMIAAAAGIGSLFAWMESVFLLYGLLQRLDAKGYEGGNAVVLFLSVHSLTYLFAAFFSRKEEKKSERFKCIAATLLMLSLPFLLHLASYLPTTPAVTVAVSGMILSAVGAALLFGRWGIVLSTLIPDDVALAFGLSPLIATFIMRFAGISHILVVILGAPLCAGILLLVSGEEKMDEQLETLPMTHFPFWRLAIFLFCLYAANGFLLSLIPELFPAPFPRAEQVSDWIRTLSALGVAVIFRFYPRAELRSFYKGAFPFIAISLFLLLFSPFQTVSRFLMEMGLAFLDLYAWLLLIYFASRAGRRRGTVINGGIFLIVLAGGVAHLHLLLNGETDLLAFAIPGVCLLLLMLALWDGREVPIQWEGFGDDRHEEKSAASSNTAEDDAPRFESEQSGKKVEMLLRMKLMEFNLTRQETEIVLLLMQGMKDRNICSMLYISQNTLKYHLRNIYRKTGSANRLELKEILA